MLSSTTSVSVTFSEREEMRGFTHVWRKKSMPVNTQHRVVKIQQQKIMLKWKQSTCEWKRDLKQIKLIKLNFTHMIKPGCQCSKSRTEPKQQSISLTKLIFDISLLESTRYKSMQSTEETCTKSYGQYSLSKNVFWI